MIKCYLLFWNCQLAGAQAVLGSNLSLSDVSSINEVDQGLNFFSVFQIDESVTPDKTVWISGYHDFINRYEVLAEEL